VKIAVLGAGNMGGALVKGLLAAKRARPRDLWVTDPNVDQRRAVQKKFGVRAGTDNRAAAAWADVVVLCVKPQLLGEVLRGLRGAVGPRHTVVSVAAGVKTATIEKILGRVPVVRAMPNTPALLRAGALVLLPRRPRRAPKTKRRPGRSCRPWGRCGKPPRRAWTP
jgi:pyrroline-5-carboxylate reductase